MTDTKFTPGPWHATHTDPAEGYDCWWITADPMKNGEKEVATVNCGYPHAKHEANAHLIAAAPDLYEWLERCLAMVEHGEGPPNWDGIRAVLAKARGE